MRVALGPIFTGSRRADLTIVAIISAAANTLDATLTNAVQSFRTGTTIRATRRFKAKSIIANGIAVTIAIDHAAIALLAEAFAVADLVFTAITIIVAEADIHAAAVLTDLLAFAVVVALAFRRHATPGSFDFDADRRFRIAAHAIAKAALPTNAINAALDGLPGDLAITAGRAIAATVRISSGVGQNTRIATDRHTAPLATASAGF